MVNITLCSIAITLLLSMIYLICTTKNSSLYTVFKSVLNPEQDKIYDNIIQERQHIYIKGLILGSILGVIYILNSNNRPRCMRICGFVVSVFLTSYLYYTLIPKSTYMLYHLNTQEQNKAWVEIYKMMKIRHHLGFIFGLFGYMFIGMVLI